MKLHLPKLLRNAVLACITAVAGIYTTVGTATFTGGVVAVSMLGQQTRAEEILINSGGTTTVQEACSGKTLDSNTTLNITNNTTLSLSDGTLNDVGKIIVDGTGSKLSITGATSLKGDITLQNGGVMELGTDAGNDGLNYNDANRIEIVNSELSMGSHRFSIDGNDAIILNNGNITGVGEGTNGAIDFIDRITATIVSDGTSSIESIRMRNGTSITYQVNSGALTITTCTNSSNGNRGGSLVKTGTGKLVLTNGIGYTGTTTVSAGELVLGGTNAPAGQITIAEGAKLTVNGGLTLNSAIQNAGVLDLSTLVEASVITLKSGLASNTYNLDNTFTFAAGGTVQGISESLTSDELKALFDIEGVIEDSTTWSYTNGALKITNVGVVWSGGETPLAWSAGTEFNNSNAFANGHHVVFDGTGTVNVDDAGVEVATMTVKGNGTVVTLQDGSHITARSEFDGFAIEDGATLILTTETGGTSALRGVVTVKSGGTLQFDAKDVTGYNGGNDSMKVINVNAGGTLYLTHTGNETFAGTLNLNGTMKAKTTAWWDLWKAGNTNNDATNAAIVVGGESSATVEEGVEVRLRKNNSKVFVDTGAKLTLSKVHHHEGNGTLVKAGSGTLLHKNAEGKPNYSIHIAGGVYEFYVGDDDSYTGAGLTGAGVLVKSGSGELKLEKTITASAVNITDGSILVKSNGVLDLTAGKDTGTGNGKVNINDDSTLKNLLEQMTNITTEGTGYVKIAGNTGGNGGDVNMIADMKLSSSNLRVNGALVLHGRAWDSNHINGHILSVEDGASLFIGTAENALSDLEIKSKATVNVTGSSILTAGLVTLGYETTQNADYYGVLSLDDATATVSGVQFRHNYAGNAFAASNSTIQFTGENIISTVGDTVTGAFRITDSTWNVTTNQSLTQSNGIAVELGGVTVDVAAEKKLTLGGELTMSGALTKTGDGTLEFASGAKLMLTTAVMKTLETTTTEVAAGQNGLASSVSYTLLSGSVTGTPTVTLDGSAEGFTYADGKIIVASENVFMVGGTYSTADAAASDDAKGSARFHVSDTGVFTLAGNVDDTKHTLNNLMTTTSGTGTIVLSGSALVSGETGTVFQGDVEIVSGGTLNLGGEGNAGETSVTKADIDSLGKIILNGGTLLVRGAACNVGDIVVKGTSSTFNCYDMDEKTDTIVADSLDLQADLTLSAVWKSTLNVKNLTGSGKLEVSGRDTWCGDNDVFTMNIEDMSEFTGSFDIKGADKFTIINANLSSGKTLNASQVVLAGEKTAFNLSGAGTYNLGNTLAMTTGVSLAEGWTGTVTAADVSVTGEMNASTLANAASKLNINGLTVADGAALTLGGKVTLDGAVTVAESIANAGALTFGSTLQLDLTGMTSAIGENGTRVITLLTGAGTSNLSSLTDAALTTATKELGTDWTFNNDGTISFVAAASAAGDLYWEGGSAAWSTQGWASTDGGTDKQDFVAGSNVIFSDTTSTITVDNAVAVGTMTVSGAEYTFERAEGNTTGTITADTLVIESGATATFGANTLAVGSLSTITVGGSLDVTAMSGGAYTDLMKKLALATGGGTIKVGAGWGIINDLDVLQFDVNIEATNAFEVLRNNGSAPAMEWTVEDSSVKVTGTGELKVGRLVNLTVGNRGIIESAGAIKLGNSNQGSGDTGSVFTLTSGGSVKAASIIRGDDGGGGKFVSSFSMSGGILELTGSAGIEAEITKEITGGILKTDTANWAINGTVSEGVVSGAKVGGVEIQTGTGTITIKNGIITSQLTNTNGNVAFEGTINLDTTNYTPAAESVTGYSDTNQGYVRSDKVYAVVTTADKATQTNTVTWQVDGSATGVSYNDATGKVTKQGDYGTEYILKSDGTYNGISKTNAEGEALTAVVLDGGVLSLNEDLGTVVKIKAQKEGTSVVDVADETTLNSSSLESNATHKIQLHGSGTFDIGTDLALGEGVELGGTSWTGIVQSGATSITSATELALGNTVELTADKVSVGNSLDFGDSTVLTMSNLEFTSILDTSAYNGDNAGTAMITGKSLTLSGGVSITSNALSNLTTGKWLLADVTALDVTNTTGTPIVGGVDGLYKYSIAVENNQIIMTGEVNGLVWGDDEDNTYFGGDTGQTWDSSATTSSQNVVFNGQCNGTDADGTVNIEGNDEDKVEVNDVSITKGENAQTESYTFTGDAIVAEGKLTTLDDMGVIIANASTFKGGVETDALLEVAEGGTLTVGDTSAASGGEADLVAKAGLTVNTGAAVNVTGTLQTDTIIVNTIEADKEALITAGTVENYTTTAARITVDLDNDLAAELTEGTYKLLKYTGTANVVLDSTDEQAILKNGYWITTGDASTFAMMRSTTSEFSIGIVDEATSWSVGEDTAVNGLQVLDADGKILSTDILDNIDEVLVSGEKTIDLTANGVTGVKLNALTADGTGAILSVTGDSAADDTVVISSGDDGYDGTIKLQKVKANLNDVEDATIVVDGATVALTGKLSKGELVVDKGATIDCNNLTLDKSTVCVDFGSTGTTLSDAAVEDILSNGLATLQGVTTDSNQEVKVGTYTDEDGFIASTAFDKYFSNITVDSNGVVCVESNDSYYSDSAEEMEVSDNARTGMALANAALAELNPQANASESGLARALDALDAAIASGDSAAADELGASLAGASTAVLGMAAHGDLDRQLQAIRNRTTTMGVDQSVVHHDMPYFNAWINAEGDYSELSDNGTEGGYKLNSWGGTVGFDVDITPTFTAGMALTAMYGDLTITGADDADGDLNTYYVSAFARYCASAWTHTFVASVGMSEFKLSRNIMGEEQESDTNGLSFGLMYEVGRVFALNEDGTACLQPIFNVTWRHTTVDGYEEEGSNLALEVDDQTLDTITLGLGARLQAVVGESMYNRTSIFEARILGKFDAGDTNGTSEVSLAGVTGEVESAERGAFGLEIGAGLTIPMGDEGGSLFMDASLELRADYTNVNGTVGYRVNF